MLSYIDASPLWRLASSAHLLVWRIGDLTKINKIPMNKTFALSLWSSCNFPNYTIEIYFTDL